MSALPQPGIFALGTTSHYYLELDRRPGTAAADLVAALASLREPRRTTNGANVVVGFHPQLWEEAGGTSSLDAAPFTPVEGPTVTMPATQHDAWVWVAGAGYDTVFDTARAALAAAAPFTVLADHAAGFGYRASRDLSGFEDGTANPTLDTAGEIAVGEDGASVALVQRWIHDLGKLHALPLADQEATIGRTKPDSVEMDEDERPEDSHLGRVVIGDGEGEELELFRRSSAYGDVVRHGLNFVAFTNDQTVSARMLDRMAGKVDGMADRLTTFTTPVTGAYYLVPGTAALHRFARDEG
jgi:putative iron-dependent peroxidase